jgi:hypothetical protein
VVSSCWSFQPKCCKHFLSPRACYRSRSSHPPWFDHSRNVWWRVHTMMLLVVRLPSTRSLYMMQQFSLSRCIASDDGDWVCLWAVPLSLRFWYTHNKHAFTILWSLYISKEAWPLYNKPCLSTMTRWGISSTLLPLRLCRECSHDSFWKPITRINCLCPHSDTDNPGILASFYATLARITRFLGTVRSMS